MFLDHLLCVAEVWGFVLDLVGFFPQTHHKKQNVLCNIIQYKYHKSDLLCLELSPARLR